MAERRMRFVLFLEDDEGHLRPAGELVRCRSWKSMAATVLSLRHEAID